jgi:hypothetical protein
MNIFTRKAHELQLPLTLYVKKRNDEMVAIRKAEEKKKQDHEQWLAHKRRENKNKPLNFRRKEHIKDMLKTLNGLPPDNTGSNICYGDGYFANSIPGREGDKDYDTAMEELIKEFGSTSTWNRFMDKVWDL